MNPLYNNEVISFGDFILVNSIEDSIDIDNPILKVNIQNINNLNVNLLFVDELVDNGLDASGVENALSVLKQLARERNKNVFLISHKDELVGRVNNVLKVVKENGFTSYANDLEITE